MNGLLSFLIAFLIVSSMRYFAGLSMTEQNFEWYYSLKTYEYMPPDYTFTVAWATIYSLLAGAIANLLMSFPLKALTAPAVFFVIHYLLHISWSYLFFELHHVLYGFYCTIALLIFLLATMYQTSKISMLSAVLLLPYALWLGVAIYLSWQTVYLNFG